MKAMILRAGITALLSVTALAAVAFAQTAPGLPPSPSAVPITDGLPYLAVVGSACGVYALSKYRGRPKKK